jgi:hypothetical protein
MKPFPIKIVIGVFLLAGLFAACDEPRDVVTDSQTVAAGGAKTAEVDVQMGAGELRLSGAAQDVLLEATFRYNRPRLRPAVDYRVSGTTGVLRVGHLRHRGFSFGRVHNEWDLRLSKSLPMEIKVDLGAGQSDLDLRGLDLEGLDIDMGVGEMKLDLRGPHTRDLRVKIDGGVGSGTLYLPADVGVRVQVDGGIGSVNFRGLMKDHRVYTNDAYGKSEVTIDIEIDAGIGSLDLRVEPSERVKL